MKKLAIVILFLLLISAAYGVTKIGIYSVKPIFKEKVAYNSFKDFETISTKAKEMTYQCKSAGNKRDCIENKLKSFTDSKLKWSQNVCASETETQKLFYDVTGVMEECGVDEWLNDCLCEKIKFPDTKEYRLVFSPIGEYPLVKLYKLNTIEVIGDKLEVPEELPAFSKPIKINSYQEYDPNTKQVKTLNGVALDFKTCKDKKYCDSSGNLQFVKTSSGVSFLKGSSDLPSCRIETNRYSFCVETDKKFESYNPYSGNVEGQPLKIRFALVIGTL